MKRYESPYNTAVKDISDYIHDRAQDVGIHPVSALEKLIFPIFAQDQTVLMESCGFPQDIFEAEAIGIWGACRELSESD